MTEISVSRPWPSILSTAVLSTATVDCGSPALAIQTAQGQWKVFGHAGAVAFSRTSYFGRENRHKHVLRRFGQVPDEYLEEIDPSRLARTGIAASTRLRQFLVFRRLKYIPDMESTQHRWS